MKLWQFCWRTLVLSAQYNPPKFVAQLMMLLVMPLAVRCLFTSEWPYLVLSLSFAIGAAILISLEQLLIPSLRNPAVMVSVIMLLICSLYGFADVANTYMFYK